MNYTIEKVTTLIGARRYGDKEANISFVLTDSRSLCFPEETLFFALKSERNDGHNYIPELYGRGVRNFVVETVPEDWNRRYPDSNFLKVVGSREALQRLAERHRDEYLVPIVGITGSNGKTMVKEWLYQLLSPQMVVTRSPRSYNSQIGVPLSVLRSVCSPASVRPIRRTSRPWMQNAGRSCTSSTTRRRLSTPWTTRC